VKNVGQNATAMTVIIVHNSITIDLRQSIKLLKKILTLLHLKLVMIQNL